MRYRIQIYFLLISFLTAISGIGFSQSSDQKIRVASIGDSVTKGFGLENPESQSYPAQLQTLYITGNFGGLKLAPVFRNQMVFQQKSVIRIWGKANSGNEVSGTFDKQVEKCVTSESGDWALTFDPVSSGGPYTLKVSAGKQTILLNDILVGELWICAGQSNMEFPRKDAANASVDISKSTNTNIRLYNLKGIVRPDDTKWDSLSLDKINKLEFLEGKWKYCDLENAGDFSAIGYYFGKMLYENLNVPVGIIQVTVGGAPIEAFIDRKTLEFDPYLVDVLNKWKQNDLIMDWCRERAALNISLSKNEFQRHPFEPAYIYEAGIQDLAGLPLSGVIWYQGESNVHNAEHYRRAFPALVESWRKTFNHPEMPFYFAQLSSLNRPSWPYFRDVQRQLSLSVPHSGMVVTSDLGDSLNVHPKRKREVGERFAKLALAKVYGQKLIGSGPEILGFRQTGEQIIIQFKPASKLKTSDGMTLRELEIAGPNGVFMPAKASIEGNEIVIQTQIKEIQKIRYGWNPFSSGNLVNEAGLPASTFKIEKQ